MLQGYFAHRAADSPLAPVVAASKRAFFSLAVASGVINVLTLTGSIFMMQVYDRVLGSQSLSTLYALCLIAVVAYGCQGWLETARGKILGLLAEKLDAELGPAVQAAGLRAATTLPGGASDAMQVQRDVDSIRTFVSGTGLVAVFDFPWILLYVVVTALLHPLFGLMTLLAAALLIWLTWKTEVASKPLLKVANDLGIKRNQLADGIIRNSEVVVSNGMIGAMSKRLSAIQEKFLEAHRSATFVIAGYGNTAKTLRMIVQSLVLALGAYLAIQGKISSGAIIGASILVARALAPIDLAINSWRPFVAAREGHERLKALLSRVPPPKKPMPLPGPKQTVVVRDLAMVAPGGNAFAVAGVSFGLKAGQAMAIIGQSASGKSSLIRGLVGAWKVNRGQVEFDATSPDQWDPDFLGKHIGYLPQDVQLFEGTIAENISRFDADATPQKVQAAAQAAGLDAYIRQQFPQTGYNTPLSASAANLSGGQRQRLGLARALYGDPFLVVLDEPNSNLDSAGKLALSAAIRTIKARGGIVVVSAHDHNILTEADMALSVHQGRFEKFGPRDEVLKYWIETHHPELAQRRPQAAAQPGTPQPAPASIKALPPGQKITRGQPSQTPPPAANGQASLNGNGSHRSNGHGLNGNGAHQAATPATPARNGETGAASAATWSSGTTRLGNRPAAPSETPTTADPKKSDTPKDETS